LLQLVHVKKNFNQLDSIAIKTVPVLVKNTQTVTAPVTVVSTRAGDNFGGLTEPGVLWQNYLKLHCRGGIILSYTGNQQ